MDIVNTQTFGKVAVIFGGKSAERSVSLKSGSNVLSALQAAGVDAEKVDPQELGVDLAQRLAVFDRAFIVLHGRDGEDGTIQGLLQFLEIPYTGSNVMASAIAMDKERTKLIWRAKAIPTPDYWMVHSQQELDATKENFSYPLMVKPAHEGSSIGMAKVESPADLQAAVELAWQYDEAVLLEQWMDGREFTVAILGDKALPVIQLKTPQGFYDFAAKYELDSTEYLIPSGLSKEVEEQIQETCLQAFNVVGCGGWGRVDVMEDSQGQLKLLEVNTVPGMTDHSLVPMAARAEGVEFQQLVLTILQQTMVDGS